ncbi:hypothetical protein [Streptomyces sp. NPDC048650]|uniref:hypothetical protein n=1 Tax=Streptomyces sp. NPDC048650 TaxID=3365583 RepID=UPI003710CC53
MDLSATGEPVVVHEGTQVDVGVHLKMEREGDLGGNEFDADAGADPWQGQTEMIRHNLCRLRLVESA